MNMRIGENLGEILLNICQEKIKNSDNPEEALSIYQDCLIDFPSDKIIDLLKGNLVLKVDEENQVMVLSEEPGKLERNKQNLYQWDFILEELMKDLDCLRSERLKIKEEFFKETQSENTEIDNYFLSGVNNYSMDSCEGLCQVAAKKMADINLAENSLLEDETWANITYNVLYDDGEESQKHERILYWTVKYVECMKKLYRAFIRYSHLYSWLSKVGLLSTKPLFLESSIESIIDKLLDFSDPNKTFHNSICDSYLTDYRKKIREDIANTEFGVEYLRNGLLKKDILDGYEAGWLSPNGDFYGMTKGCSALIHLDTATLLYNNGKGDIGEKMAADRVNPYSQNSPERWLEKKGWIKIHGDSIYGGFSIHDKEREDSEYQYCPTERQVEEICKYINKHYNGKFYTEYPTFGIRSMRPDPVFAYKLRQMDRPMLHKTFSL